MKKETKIENKEKWLELIRSGDAWCYIKPNRHVHESGYMCFEVGYLTRDKARNRTNDKLVLNTYADHIDLGSMEMLRGRKPMSVNMDVLLDGYIRLWVRDETPIWWGSVDWTTSSSSLTWLKETL